MNYGTIGALQEPPAVRNQAATPPGAAPKLNVVNGDAVAQWVELKEAYLELRGSTAGKHGKAIPKTTHADVMQIATAWTAELKKVSPRADYERSEHERWKACAAKVAALYDKPNPNAEYADNEHFWQECTKRLSIYLQARKVVPSKWELAVESVVEAVAELPQVVGGAVKSTASAAAKVIKDPAKLAAVLLGAAILLPPVIRAFRK